MQNLKKKVDALMRFALAETEQSRKEAVAAIRNLLSSTEEAAQDAESLIRTVLLELGIPDHVLGHRYLVTAILMAVHDPAAADQMTHVLYPTVANRYSTTGSRVNRAMRHAVELAFDRGDTDTLYRYFGNTVNGYKGKATNSEFIIRIANHIRAQI